MSTPKIPLIGGGGIPVSPQHWNSSMQTGMWHPNSAVSGVFSSAPLVLCPLTSIWLQSYVIAVITNQGSLSLNRDQNIVKSESVRLANFKSKVDAIFSQLEFPITLLAATARDLFRKPRTQMWYEVLKEFDLDSADGLHISACFFVGDAGGRPARSDAKADHSCVDRSEWHCRYMHDNTYWM